MATLYVNSITGNNSNSGASWALAKLTLAATQTAATAGDTIYCHGSFGETFTITKTLTWIGSGYFCWNGLGKTLTGFRITAVTKFRNMILRDFVTYGLSLEATAILEDCVVQNCDRGVRSFDFTAICYATNCVFQDNNIAAFWTNNNLSVFACNCVFAGNAISFERNTSGSPSFISVKCAFRDLIMWNVAAASYVGLGTEGNVYDFAFGKCVVAGVDKTSLASWVAALTAPRDARSIDRAWSSDVGDCANGLLRPNPASYLLTAGPGSTPVGLTLPAVTVSNTTNASLWTGGIFSQTEIDGSGYLVLSAGQTSGYWRSDIIDFGASISAKSLEVSVAGEYAANYLDYDTGDSPGYFTARVRGSNVSFAKADASPSWVTVPRNAEIGAYMANALRYWQVELTLRGP